MEPTKMKKAWMMPELTVLVRSKPEEAVLTGCKGFSSGGPADVFGICTTVFVGCEECYPSFLS